MQYTEKELNKLIEDVEKEFTTHLAKAEEAFNASKLAKSEEESAAPVVDGTETLAKAEDDKPADKPEEKKEEPKSEEKPAAEAKEGEGDKPAAEAPAKEEGKEAAPAEKPAAEAPAADEGHGYDDEDLEHMSKMYSSMSKAELKAHHDAIKNCLDAACATEQAAAPEAQEAAPMAKSEETSVEVKAEEKAEEKPAEEVELLKSEISAKSAKVEELQKNLDVVTEFLTKLFAKKPAPAGKAITNLDAIQKSEGGKEEKTLTKSEITTILAKKAADPSLTKSDREAINAYYLNGASIDKISHLLK